MSKPMMTVDDENLVKLFRALSPKQREKALKGALGRAGTLVRKKAILNLKKALPKAGKKLERTIRRINYRNKMGFRVTIGTDGKIASKIASKGVGSRIGRVLATDDYFYLNSKGKLKPVPIWAEGGTDFRYTKTESSWRGSRRKRKGHATGYMRGYGFMEKTRQEMNPKIDELLKKEINLNIQRIAKKYGCTIS